MRLSDEILAWVVLSHAPALDASSLGAALARVESAAAILALTDAERERAGIPAAAREYLARSSPAVSASERRWLEGARHHLVPFTDPSYPKLLRRAGDPPIALYVAGNVEPLLDPQLAVVGSRNPTRQGLGNAFEIARCLALRGLGITSGLALGIDTAAHRGALASQGITVGVLGSGLDVVYPRCNRGLGEAIEQSGALVSGFPLGTPPRRANFPRRNHVIAALTLGTLVVEAAHGSGSLITARSAGALGRRIFAIPGSIHSPLSRGCHQLIKAARN